MKTYTLEELQDKFIGQIGTPDRDKFEYDLQIDSLGDAIKQARKEQHLTQEELGKIIGVQKEQISKLENKASNAKMDTIMRAFTALKAKITLKVELPHTRINVSQ